MRAAWQLFAGDVRNLAHSVVGLVVVLGLVVVPALYAWFNILGGWDPYENTGGLKVAVANEDAGYHGDLVPLDVNIGDDVEDALRANKQLDWVFTDADAAVEGVKSGAYFAAIVIPKSFSDDMMTLFSDDIHHSDIVYYTNQKENAIAPRVTSEGASDVQSNIDRTFAETVDQVGLKTVSQLAAYLDSDSVGSYAAALSRSLGSAALDLEGAAAQARSFAALAGATSALAGTSAHLLDGAGASVGTTRELLGDAAAGTQDVSGALDAASALADDALTQGMAGLDAVAERVEAALGALDGRADTAAGDLTSAAADVRRLAESYAAVRDAVAAADPTSPALGALDRAVALLQSLDQALSQASTDLDGAAEQAAASRQAVRTLVDEARQQLEDARHAFHDNLATSVDALKSSLAAAQSSATTLSDDLAATAAGLSQASGSLETSLAATRDTLNQSASALADASANVNEAKARLDDALSRGDLNEVRALIGSDPQGLASFLAAPVSLDRHAVYGIANYGSAMAGFYTILCLWVGAIILVALLEVKVSDRRIAQLGGNVSLSARYFGRFGIFAVLALLQSTVVCAGDLFFVGVQCEHPLLFMVAGWVASLVFCLIMYTLVVSFGDIGKAIAVVLLVMQVAGSGGTFPVQMMSDFFQAVYPYLPFTHAISALHSCIGGIYGNQYAVQLGKLLLFAVPALLLGLVLRRPVIRLNDYVIRKLEETKIM
ncbi:MULTISPECIES: YhgE/Pip domain-containing protein [Gordonibacter]|uniref:YhgE/Pip domain-containing protein n=1 Tax=Gordonibacter faecis TaxID=3047475 RepID=A0ABT7DNZ6_9ACTN|nr:MULTISPECIES: YhgE/Pip domain-containing protein [unclassified Gordonibacter]MDJ1651259.1 YhgE/Pip domain-containing protein [Gordonibacter sp. KGMB12511]HIW76192.1 YhgE/Pip domain-containing protein [Candidatus Gordonibacter avicola]